MMTAMRMKKNMLAYALPVSFIFWPPELDHSIEFCGIWGPVDHKVPLIFTFSGVRLATCFFFCAVQVTSGFLWSFHCDGRRLMWSFTTTCPLLIPSAIQEPKKNAWTFCTLVHTCRIQTQGASSELPPTSRWSTFNPWICDFHFQGLLCRPATWTPCPPTTTCRSNGPDIFCKIFVYSL